MISSDTPHISYSLIEFPMNECGDEDDGDKCICGAEKVYKECNPYMHYDWCPKYRERK